MHALRRILDDNRAVIRASSMPHSHLHDRLSTALALTFVVDIVAGCKETGAAEPARSQAYAKRHAAEP